MKRKGEGKGEGMDQTIKRGGMAKDEEKRGYGYIYYCSLCMYVTHSRHIRDRDRDRKR